MMGLSGRLLVNQREQTIKVKYESEGWRMLRNGAPDFIALKVDEAGNILEIKGVEVKSPKDKLTYEQAVYRKVFQKAGIDYIVEAVI